MFYGVAQYGKLFNVPVAKVFEYFSKVESYTEHYPNSCVRVDIMKSDGQEVELMRYGTLRSVQIFPI
jgi:hypothetical protein